MGAEIGLGSLHASEGVLLLSAQSVYDTPVTPVDSVGIAEYNATDDADFRQFFTVGRKNLFKNKAGIYKVDWQVRINGLGSPTLLERAVRVGGVLPWTTWGFGSDANDAAPEAWQVQDCKPDGLEVSLDGGGILSASLQGIGGLKTTLTTLVADPGDEAPFFSYEAVATLAGVEFPMLSFRMNVNHNLEMQSVIRGAAVASAKLRRWDFLREGNEEISGTVTLARKFAKDFQAACPAEDGDLVLTLTEACNPSNTFAINLEAVEFLNQVRNMPSEGFGNFELPFNAKGWSID